MDFRFSHSGLVWVTFNVKFYFFNATVVHRSDFEYIPAVANSFILFRHFTFEFQYQSCKCFYVFGFFQKILFDISAILKKSFNKIFASKRKVWLSILVKSVSSSSYSSLMSPTISFQYIFQRYKSGGAAVFIHYDGQMHRFS